MRRTIRFLSGALLAAALVSGCGPDKTVTVGEPGEKGVIKRDIDKANAVGSEATKQLKDGEGIAYGS